jgi:MFS family permease
MGNLSDGLINTDLQSPVRKTFNLYAVLFSLNHATVTSPLVYSTSLLGATANIGNGVLFICTLLSSLLCGTGVVGAFGPLQGSVMAMALYTVYVVGFACCCLQPGSEFVPVVFAVVSGIGGIGAGILWTSQGAVFAAASRAIATDEGVTAETVTAELGAQFASVYLAGEVIAKASVTGLKLATPLSFTYVWSMVFFVYAFIAGMSTFLASRCVDLPSRPEPGPLFGKALAAIELMPDVRVWLLSFTNLTFGFSAAFMNGYVNAHYVNDSPAFSAAALGFLSAITAVTAGLSAPVFARLSARVGKGWVVFLGSLAFMTIPLCVIFADVDRWGVGVLLFFVLQGLGRGVYESTNKVVFADFFPGKAPGAFANCMMQNSSAFAACFFLSAAFQNSPDVLAGIVLTLAFLTGPAYALAAARSP